MGMTNEEREKHIRIANMLIGAINDLIRPMLMYQIEKDVTKEALENYIKMLEQQPCEDVVSIGVFEQVKWERDVAIEQLEQLGYSLGEKIRTSEDCISREAVIKIFGEVHPMDYNTQAYITNIQNLPSVTPKGVTITDFADRCRECGRIKYSNLQDWLSTFNTESATECFTAVQQLKERMNE